MEFLSTDYKLILEPNDENININLYKLNDLKNSNLLIYLKLSPLHEINTDDDDKDTVRDIPRDLFIEGDYYQSATTRYAPRNNVSLLNVIHNILIENNAQLPFINNIFSSSLNEYEEENFFSDPAKNFWIKQLEKSKILPISFFEEDQRYKIIINENYQN